MNARFALSNLTSADRIESRSNLDRIQLQVIQIRSCSSADRPLHEVEIFASVLMEGGDGVGVSKIVASWCDQCVWAVGVVTGHGHWVGH